MTPDECYLEAYWKGSRIPEYEPIILTSPDASYRYALYVIKGRWPEAEPIILSSPRHSYWYAQDIIKGRWPEAESIIISDGYFSYCYASEIIKGRWPEAEPIILVSSRAREYYKKFKSKFTKEERTLWLLHLN